MPVSMRKDPRFGRWVQSAGTGDWLEQQHLHLSQRLQGFVQQGGALLRARLGIEWRRR